MKNIILFVFLNFVFIGYINAQTPSNQVFDNFAAASGIRVRVVAQKPLITKSQSAIKPLVKKTVSATNTTTVSVSTVNNQTTEVKLVAKTVMSSGSRSLGGFSTGDSTIDSYIADSSARYNIDPLLIYAQMHQESGFKKRATSYKGASGLMQLMPATAIRFGVTDIYNSQQNIDAGVKYMRWLLNKFNGDVNLALAGYNAGEGAVMKYGNQIPPYKETQGYVKKISAHYNSIRKQSAQKTANKPVTQTIAKTEKQQSVSTATKLAQSASTIRLANGKKALTNL